MDEGDQKVQISNYKLSTGAGMYNLMTTVNSAVHGTKES